ncbi:uncharacterized protein AMSG_00599 [Thecamonas trahens ATCC 50062]|uniref:Lysozyme n=1 Tax=Thecamonas trahens ATCC 50062 TaxID=461836 RepID=A0A0L0DBY4_THETB|nr:hypothetical protein AMSG_00599 [Thecamonas trahens ATCC 50062]KNC48818.1 hypothetical protein AMSG_00599 [Thecamonas trahens ATCC 50062]|eukprot:XP_013762869.1 hypothetical protein AMSG_00599 [Thecamonas trahens ATCC 50062]
MQTKVFSVAVLAIVAIVAMLAVPSQARAFGIDVSSGVSESQFSSGHRHGNFSFAIPRIWQSFGRGDPNGAANVRNAHAAGYSKVDGYAFICPNGGSVSSQISGLFSYLNDNHVNIDTVWLDVEAPSLWTGSVSGNRNYMTELIDAMNKSGLKYGIYSSPGEWSSLFGSWRIDFPRCWYATYDGSLSCSSEPFPGCRPMYKQFNDHDSFCSNAGFSCDVSVSC